MPGERLVVGGGMDRKVTDVNRGALRGDDGVHVECATEEPPRRSQSVHSSNEAP